MVKIPNPIDEMEENDEETEETEEVQEPEQEPEPEPEDDEKVTSEEVEEVPEEEVKDSPIVPEDSDQSPCTRYEVCGNITYGNTCVECWEDIREQLETGECEECGNNTFKFIPDQEEVGLQCQECGDTTWQKVEYTGGDEETKTSYKVEQ